MIDCLSGKVGPFFYTFIIESGAGGSVSVAPASLSKEENLGQFIRILAVCETGDIFP